MADTLVEASVAGGIPEKNGLWGAYRLGAKGVGIFVNNSTDPATTRTIDSGATWVDTTIEAVKLQSMAAYFDQETPGDTGTLVHVCWLDETADEFRYTTVDVETGTIGTLRTIDATITVGPSNNDNRCAITKTRNGNLIAALSTQNEIRTYRSVDAGVTWTTRADVYETTTEEDYVLLYPANTGDGADAAAFFWDRSVDEISVKMYDDSANTWTETSILTSMSDDPSLLNMDGSTRHSDGLILGSAHSDEDSAGDDLRTWTVNPNSIASPTITTKTNVFTNQAESAMVSVFINQQNDEVFVTYCKGGTWEATVDVVYHRSTDGMTTWGAEQPYSQAAADDFRLCPAGRTVGDSGGFFQPLFYNDDPTEIFVNLVNDVSIAAVTATLQAIDAIAVGVGAVATTLTKLAGIAATAVGVAVVQSATIFGKLIAATAVGVATVVKTLIAGVQIAATAVGVAVTQTTALFFRTIAATAVGVAVVQAVATMAKLIAATAVGVATVAKTLIAAVQIAATALGVAVLQTTVTFAKAIAAVAVGVASFAQMFFQSMGSFVASWRRRRRKGKRG